jgi:hypothetical protein
MADITKCANINCQIKETCYRFTAPSNECRQSFALFKCDEENKYQNRLEV